MRFMSRARRLLAAVMMLAVGTVGLASSVSASSARAARPAATVVSAMWTKVYGLVLIVGGSGGLAGAPLYAITSDAMGKFGCNPTPLEHTQFGPTTCTGPEGDLSHNVLTDDWPALNTTGAPLAGPGVDPHLLGSVYRKGVGRQVTYAGHPLYLFDPPSHPFVPAGEGFFQSTLPLPPWHGLWNLVSPHGGLPAPGVATVETATLANGHAVVGAETYPTNGKPGGVAIPAYTYSRDGKNDIDCLGRCALIWIPVLTTGQPKAGIGISPTALSAIRRPDGSEQVTYLGKPLYLYSLEHPVAANGHLAPTGNGNGIFGPGGGIFTDIPLS